MAKMNISVPMALNFWWGIRTMDETIRTSRRRIRAIIALIGSAGYARIFLRFSESPTKTNPPSVAAAPSWAVKNGCQACKIVSGAPIQELDHLVPMIALFSRSICNFSDMEVVPARRCLDDDQRFKS